MSYSIKSSVRTNSININKIRIKINVETVIMPIVYLLAFYVSISLSLILYLFNIISIKRPGILSYFYPIIIGSIIAFTQYCTYDNGDYDIIRYYNSFRILSEVNFSEAIIYSVFQRDFGFYMVTYAFTKFCPDDPRYFSFIFYLITNTLLLYCYRFYNRDTFDTRTGLILFTIGIFLIVNFFNSTNAFRQNFATSIFFFITTFKKMNFKTVLAIVFSVSCHWSIVMYLIPYLCLKYGRFHNIKILGLISLIIGILGGTILTIFISSYAQGYMQQEELGVDKTIMVVLTVSICSSVYFFSKTKILLSNLYDVVLAFFIVCLIFVTRSTILARVSYAWTQLYIILIPILLTKTLNYRYKQFTYFMIVMFIFYNLKMLWLASGRINYMLFTTYGLNSSFLNVFNTPCLM